MSMKRCTLASSSIRRHRRYCLSTGFLAVLVSHSAGASGLPSFDVGVGKVIGWSNDGRYFHYCVHRDNRKSTRESASAGCEGGRVLVVDGFTGARLTLDDCAGATAREKRGSTSEVGRTGTDFRHGQRGLEVPAASREGENDWKILYRHDDGFGRWKGTQYWYDHGIEGELWPGRSTLHVGLKRWGREFWYLRRITDTDFYSFGMRSVWAFASPDQKRIAWVFATKGYCGTERCVAPELEVEITALGGPRVELAVPFLDFERAWRISVALLSAGRFAPTKVYAAADKERKATQIYTKASYLRDARTLGALLRIAEDSIKPLTWETTADVVLALGKDLSSSGGNSAPSRE